MRFYPRSKWTFDDINALRELVGMTWEEFGAAVNLSPNFLKTHIARKYQELGAIGVNSINAFVEQWNDEHPEMPYDEPPRESSAVEDFLSAASSLLYKLVRAAPPNDAATMNVGVQDAGRFLIRRTFTRCPKCRYAEERTFEFKTKTEATDAYEKARAWLEAESPNIATPGLN